MSERIIGPDAQSGDAALDLSLRPRRLDDDEFVNQTRVKEQLRIAIEAARHRGEPLDHVLLHGAAGLGKTTLANIIATELGVRIRTTAGPAIERQGDLAAIATNMRRGDVFFIDEIHRLNRIIEEVLYPVMEDFTLDVVIGKGPAAKTMRLPLPPFTIIGATTRVSLLTAPLRDRFGLVFRLDFYDEEAMAQIVTRSAGILGVPIAAGGALEIAQRSRRTPRVANRLLKRVRDYAQVRADGSITVSVARDALEMLEVDAQGLDAVDRLILKTILTKFGGGPVGLDTIAAAVGEESETIQDVYEPYLIQLGYLQPTRQGRLATPLAARHLGLPHPNDGGAEPPRQGWLL